MGCPRILRGVHRDSVRAGKSHESAGARRLSRFGGSGFSLASRMLRLSFERDRVAVRVAPLSWVIAHDVNEGRAVLNFSTWNQLSPEKQAEAMKESWEEVAEGKMPTWYYVPLHPEARLSANDQSVLRGWSSSAVGKEEGENDDD
jgi:Haem-binding domain